MQPASRTLLAGSKVCGLATLIEELKTEINRAKRSRTVFDIAAKEFKIERKFDTCTCTEETLRFLCAGK